MKILFESSLESGFREFEERSTANKETENQEAIAVIQGKVVVVRGKERIIKSNSLKYQTYKIFLIAHFECFCKLICKYTHIIYMYI